MLSARAVCSAFVRVPLCTTLVASGVIGTYNLQHKKEDRLQLSNRLFLFFLRCFKATTRKPTQSNPPPPSPPPTYPATTTPKPWTRRQTPNPRARSMSPGPPTSTATWPAFCRQSFVTSTSKPRPCTVATLACRRRPFRAISSRPSWRPCSRTLVRVGISTTRVTAG